MRAGRRRTNHAINRRLRKRVVIARRPRVNAYVNAPNVRGFKRDEIHTIVWTTRTGQALGVLWSYACHPVAFPSSTEIAAHYPHVVRQRLRAHFNSDHLPVVFLQGFSGNLRPSASAALNGLRRRARRILTGPVFSDMTREGYRAWTSTLASDVVACVEDGRSVRSEGLSVRRTVRPAEAFVSGASQGVSFHAARLAPGLVIAGVSAEAVSEFVPLIEAQAPGEHLVLAGCLDDTYGYAPTTEILQQGGYEAGGFCDAFGLGEVPASVEAAVIEGFVHVLEGVADEGE